MELVKASGSFAVAMDIDGAGLPFLKNLTPPAGSKTEDELREVAEMAGVPFIIKGIMNGRSKFGKTCVQFLWIFYLGDNEHNALGI